MYRSDDALAWRTAGPPFDLQSQFHNQGQGLIQEPALAPRWKSAGGSTPALKSDTWNGFIVVRKALSVRTQVVSLQALWRCCLCVCVCAVEQGCRYVWWTSWNMSSRGMGVSAPYMLEARRSNAETICFTTSSKKTWASWEWMRERNSKEIWGGEDKVSSWVSYYKHVRDLCVTIWNQSREKTNTTDMPSWVMWNNQYMITERDTKHSLTYWTSYSMFPSCKLLVLTAKSTVQVRGYPGRPGLKRHIVSKWLNSLPSEHDAWKATIYKFTAVSNKREAAFVNFFFRATTDFIVSETLQTHSEHILSKMNYKLNFTPGGRLQWEPVSTQMTSSGNCVVFPFSRSSMFTRKCKRCL